MVPFLWALAHSRLRVQRSFQVRDGDACRRRGCRRDDRRRSPWRLFQRRSRDHAACAVFSMGVRHLNQMNGRKNGLSFIAGLVAWPQAVVTMTAAMIGVYLGAPVAGRFLHGWSGRSHRPRRRDERGIRLEAPRTTGRIHDQGLEACCRPPPEGKSVRWRSIHGVHRGEDKNKVNVIRKLPTATQGRTQDLQIEKSI